MLKVKDISLSFGDKKILDKISFTLHDGQAMIITGKSGVGKSTLLKILADIIPFDSGEIWLDGKEYSQDLLCKENRVGIVFQQFHLFPHLTVFDNIALAPLYVQKRDKHEIEKEIVRLLTLYDLIDQRYKFPNELSGGQKQRVALIRTLILNPNIILLDEPTSGLDRGLTDYIVSVIKDLKKQSKIIIMTSHDTLLIDQMKSDALFCHLLDGKCSFEQI
jgi:polar amino acid transport system ATP-binding protein